MPLVEELRSSGCSWDTVARSGSVAQYKPKRVDDSQIVERLKAIAMERRRFGYRRLTIMLRREGFTVNHKRVYRIYDAHDLQVRARKKRGVRHVRGNAISPATRPNERWSVDFVSDTLSTGRRFRAFTIIDDSVASVSGSKWTSRLLAFESQQR